MIPTDWLDERVSVEEAERRNPGVAGERIARHPELGKPLGALNAEWEALKAALQPGDQIWTFASPSESWRSLAGRVGLALVRSGCPIKAVTTIMN